MSDLLDYAKKEMELCGYGGPNQNDHDAAVYECVLDLLEVLAKQEHSNHSIHFVLHIFHRLSDFKPLSPLTGAADEWNVINKNGDKQNKRCPLVFMDADGSAYIYNGRIFREPDGTCCINRNSKVPVTFPYTVPDKPEIVDVDFDGNPINKEN